MTSRRLEYESLLKELGLSQEQLKDCPEPDVQNRENELRIIKEQEQSLSEELKGLRREIEKLKEQYQNVSVRKATLEEQQANAEKTIQDLIGQAGSEDAVEKQYQEARRERDAAKDKLHELELNLPPEDQHPRKQAERLKGRIQNLEQDLGVYREKAAVLQDRIRHIAESGSYEKLTRLREQLDLSRRDYEKCWREAHAIKLIYTLFQARKRWISDQLATPVSTRVSRYFEQISGRVGREIQFDEAMKPSSISYRGKDGISPEALSQGAREQLNLLTRLALARYLAQQEGRMLFLLDDALVHTDPTRHQRLLELLEDAATDLQVIVLTCHPERYGRLAKARQILLTAYVNNSNHAQGTSCA